uniref:Uncharacterized protein n=1 Tax=Chromera velia CCMP2878 TaxID=1169474 RepID=A0A0G4G155_9ALVE|eukprot:Cvel_19642.t1-p1 / transcript=Cvel_19642.t1 / gene=Cvel_19642 / organism=Chromera_velia_CCMP2878 / gene_product=hypothetical protein / transcript_product=hypothetical protein / location=Cvel_scaffold1711:14403-15480(-) / protein_length=252 / sequence_SO=supercontig / SO=protein_coding / is_pseudo=false
MLYEAAFLTSPAEHSSEASKARSAFLICRLVKHVLGVDTSEKDDKGTRRFTIPNDQLCQYIAETLEKEVVRVTFGEHIFLPLSSQYDLIILRDLRGGKNLVIGQMPFTVKPGVVSVSEREELVSRLIQNDKTLEINESHVIIHKLIDMMEENTDFETAAASEPKRKMKFNTVIWLLFYTALLVTADLLLKETDDFAARIVHAVKLWLGLTRERFNETELKEKEEVAGAQRIESDASALVTSVQHNNLIQELE